MGVIDTLTAGFQTVYRRLWLLTIPVLLDLFFWLGPKLSIGQVMDTMLRTLGESVALVGSPELDATTGQVVSAATDLVQDTVGRTNLFVLLAWDRLGVPTVGVLQRIDPERDTIIEVGGMGQLVVVQFLLLVLGLFVACVFLGMLGQVVRGEGLNPQKLAGRVPSYFLHFATVLVPLLVLLIIVLSSTVLLGSLSFVVWVIALWVLLYLSFVPEAVTMAEAGPLRAVVSSLTVVRLNFWPVIGLILLINLISMGFGLIWQELLGTPVGTVAAIVLNAYVGTSLTAASFIFFRDRLARWYQLAKEQRST